MLTVLCVAIVVFTLVGSQTDNDNENEEEPNTTEDRHGNCRFGLWPPTKDNDRERVYSDGLHVQVEFNQPVVGSIAVVGSH